MKDTKLKSLSEVTSNIVSGYIINFFGNELIIPLYAGKIFQAVLTNDQHTLAYLFAEMGMWYTVISVARMYGFRRLFNKYGAKENLFTLAWRLGKYIRKHLCERKHKPVDKNVGR
jgi:hypothetical protein